MTSEAVSVVREARKAAREAQVFKLLTDPCVLVPLSNLANFAATNQLSKGENPIITADQAAVLRGAGITCSILYLLRGQDVAGAEIAAAVAAGALSGIVTVPNVVEQIVPGSGSTRRQTVIEGLVSTIQGWLGPLGRLLP